MFPNTCRELKRMNWKGWDFFKIKVHKWLQMSVRAYLEEYLKLQKHNLFLKLVFASNFISIEATIKKSKR